MRAVLIILKITLALGVIAYTILVGTIYFQQRALLFPGASRPQDGAPQDKAWGEQTFITTPDGEQLAALSIDAGAGRPTILFFAGNGDNVANYGFLAEQFRASGIGFVAVSYRGYPGSTGSPSETGFLTDGLAAFDWLTSWHTGPIVVMGRSLGSGVAVNVAAEREAAGLVLVSPYDSVQAIAQGRYWFIPVGLLIKDSFRSDLRIGRVEEPKLFLHGDMDTVVSLASGEALFALAAEPKRLSIQSGLRHNDIWNASTVAEIIAFVDARASAQAN